MTPQDVFRLNKPVIILILKQEAAPTLAEGKPTGFIEDAAHGQGRFFPGLVRG